MDMNDSLSQQLSYAYAQQLNQQNMAQVAQMQSNSHQMGSSQMYSMQQSQQMSMSQALWNITLGQDKLRMSDQERDDIGRHLGYRAAETGVNVGNTINQFGTSLAGVLAPGIGPMIWWGAAGAGLSAITNTAQNQLKTRMGYEDYLSTNSYRMVPGANSTSRYGAGFDLKQTQDISNFLTHVGSDKFLDAPEIKQILQNATDGDMLRDLHSVQDFKDKFTKIIDTVKTMAVGLHESMQEASKFMGDMERAGVTSGNMLSTRFGMRTTASFIGANDAQLKNTLLSTSQGAVANTSADISSEIGKNELSMMLMHNALDRAEGAGDKESRNLIMNANYAGQTGQVAAGLLVNNASTNFLNTQVASIIAGGAFSVGSNGKLEFDANKMNQLIKSGDINSMSTMATSNITNLGAKGYDLETQLPELIANLNPDQKQQILNGILDNAKNSGQFKGLDMATVISALTGGAVSGSSAQYLALNNSEFNKTGNFIMNQRKLDTVFGISEAANDTLNVSPWDKAKYWWQDTFSNKIGDMVQPLADIGGNMAEWWQEWRTGVPRYQQYRSSYTYSADQWANKAGTLQGITQDIIDAGRSENQILEKYGINVGSKTLGTNPIDYTQNAMMMAIQGNKGAADLIKDVDNKVSNTITDSEFTSLLSVDPSSLSGSQLAKIEKLAKDNNFNADTQRAQYLLNRENGAYNGKIGTARSLLDRGRIGVVSIGESIEKTVSGIFSSGGSTLSADDMQKTLSEYEKSGNDLKDAISKSEKPARDLLGKVGESMSQDQLNRMWNQVKQGDVQGVTQSLANSGVSQDVVAKFVDAANAHLDYNNYQDKTQGISQRVDQVSDFAKKVAASDTMESVFTANLTDDKGKSIIDPKLAKSIFGSAYNVFKGKNIDKMSLSDILSKDQEAQNNIASGLSGLSPSQLSAIAKKLIANNYASKDQIMGSGDVVDVDALTKVLYNVSNEASQKGTDGDEKKSSADKALSDHQQAFSKLVNVMVSEINTMNKASTSLGGTNVAGPSIAANNNTSMTSQSVIFMPAG